MWKFYKIKYILLVVMYVSCNLGSEYNLNIYPFSSWKGTENTKLIPIWSRPKWKWSTIE